MVIPLSLRRYQVMEMTVIRKQCLRSGDSGQNALVEDDLQIANNHCPDGKCLQVTEHRSSGRLVGITYRVVYGDPNEIPGLLGLNTSYVERTNLTSRQMNGRMVRKTLSFSKKEETLAASCAWEGWIYILTRPIKSLRFEINEGLLRWQSRSAAMAAGLNRSCVDY